MHIHQDNSLAFLQALVTSISKDPLSFEAWKCLHIRPMPGEQPNVVALEVLRASNKDADCDVVLCPDHDILLISRHMDSDAMLSIGAALCGALNEAPETTLYSLFRDWRTVRGLILGKTHDTPLPSMQHTPHDFGEMASLQDILEGAKQMRASRHPQHILVVEDDAVTRRMVANAFRDSFAVITAHDGTEAIGSYLLHAPDIVFLDIGLPDASGFDVLQIIIAQDPEAYVVMFSSRDDMDSINRAFQQGASGFIAKPFRREVLRHYVLGSVEHHQKPYS